MNWDDYFFRIMRAVAAKSKDRSVKVGAVVAGPEHEVLSVGYNGFPRGVDDDAAGRCERPAKYLWTEHAERNAIYNAARVGTALCGSTIYVSCPPCSRCARAIIQAGIARVVAEMGAADFLPARSAIAWRGDVETAGEMLREAGVTLGVVDEATEGDVWQFCGQSANVADVLKKVQREFRVTISGIVLLTKGVACDNCGAKPHELDTVGFYSRGGRFWTLCADREACRARREAQECRE